MDDDPFGPARDASPRDYLTADMADDDLCEVLTAWVAADADAALRQREIDDYLAVISDLAHEEVWDLVLEVVSCMRRRGDDLAVVIARRAFEDAGRHTAVEANAPDETGGDALPALSNAVLGADLRRRRRGGS